MSVLVTQKYNLTFSLVKAFHYMEHVSNEKNGTLTKPFYEEPPFLRFYSRKLYR